MLIHPWDAAAPDEWRRWLGTTAPLGQLVVTNNDPAEAPIVVPTHAVIEGPDLLVHLARPNQAWPHITAHPRVLFTVRGRRPDELIRHRPVHLRRRGRH